MLCLRNIAVSTSAIAAFGLVVLGTPAVSNAATADPAPVVSNEAAADAAPAAAQVDLCANVKAAAGPFLSLVGAGLMPLGTALNINSDITGATVPQILGCLV
jgi:hypothetical protein